MKKNGLLLSILVLSPLSLSLANTTDINIVNDTAKLSHNGDQSVVTLLKKDSSNLSHIKYDKFNVGSEGMTVNNHIGTDTIINEVISQSASELNGEIRIKGKKAKFTLINPNGIVCANECSFRNTTSANLVVGKTMLASRQIIGRSPGDSKLIIKSSTKKIASHLLLIGQNIEINNSNIRADYLQISNIFNYKNGNPKRNRITVDNQSKIRAKEIKINVIDTDILNYGIIRGNLNGMLLASAIINDEKMAGKNITPDLFYSATISGTGTVKFKNHQLSKNN